MAKYDKLLAKMVTPFGYQEMKALEPRVTATEATAAALGSQLNGVVASIPEAPAWEELGRIKQVLAFSLIPGHRNVGGIDAGLWVEGLAADWPPDWIFGDWLHDDTLSFSPWTPNPAWVPFPAQGVATTGTLAVTLTGSSDGRWSVNNGSTWYASGTLVTLPEGAYEVSYKSVPGLISPTRYPVTITPGGAVAFTAGYTTLEG